MNELFNDMPFNLAGEELREEIDQEGERRLDAENKANERKAQLTLATMPNEYAGPFPRKRHSHRCPYCTNAVACYRAHCHKPQRITREQCQWHR